MVLSRNITFVVFDQYELFINTRENHVTINLLKQFILLIITCTEIWKSNVVIEKLNEYWWYWWVTIVYIHNLKSVDFLGIMFDLVSEIYKPYCKPNNKPLYINKHSNHPPNILKQLPKSIEKRISETSSNIDVFNRSIKSIMMHYMEEILKKH